MQVYSLALQAGQGLGDEYRDGLVVGVPLEIAVRVDLVRLKIRE